MKKLALLLFFAFLSIAPSFSEDRTIEARQESQIESSDQNHATEVHQAPTWTVVPFVLLLLMIATGPLFYEHFWHKNYPIIAMVLAAMVVAYYLFVLSNNHAPIHALAEYIQFIALLASLFIASGGIMINVDQKSTPLTNIILLLVGAVMANFIGTTGASMLLIRPFIRLNKTRLKPYLVVFFIFIVSNLGGALTPIGDPPLFLGFLKGVPFIWTLEHNFAAWALAITALLIIFYVIDRKNVSENYYGDEPVTYTNKITIKGLRNFAWLGVIIAAVFIDPNIMDWVPSIAYDGQKISFLRESIMLAIAFLAYKFANKEAIKTNDFSFEPIREVAFIFIGIFMTMMPALELVSNYAKSEEGKESITHNSLYWGTGTLSAFLDNAPTYVNFLAASMAAEGTTISSVSEVRKFAEGGHYHDSVLDLQAISIAAVFFGAMTYIGNGPNFMVKSIAEQIGIRMPSFFGYILRYAIPILLPILFGIWLIFFAFKPI